MTASVFGSGATFDSGRYRVDTLLRGHALHGLYSGVRMADDAAVLVTIRATDWAAIPVDDMRISTDGVAPLLFAGPPDGYAPPAKRWPGASTIGAVVELSPTGRPLSARGGHLTARELIRLASGLLEAVAARAGMPPILGIRPETTYVEGVDDALTFTGVAPRSIRILSHYADEYGRAFEHSFDAPELYTHARFTETSDLFSTALTLWAAFTGAHPYRLCDSNPDEEVIASDDRPSFPGPPEIGRLLERILVADPARRPTVHEVGEEVTQLAKRWSVPS